MGRDPSELMQAYISLKIGEEERANLTGPGGTVHNFRGKNIQISRKIIILFYPELVPKDQFRASASSSARGSRPDMAIDDQVIAKQLYRYLQYFPKEILN